MSVTVRRFNKTKYNLWLRILDIYLPTYKCLWACFCFDFHKMLETYIFWLCLRWPNVLVVLCLWQIILCIYPLSRLEPWPGRKNPNCRCLWNPSPATKYSCWQGQRFFQSILPLKHKIHQCTYPECFYWHELLSGDKTAAAGRLKQQMRNTRAQRRRRKWLRKRAVTSAVAGGWWLLPPVLPGSCVPA